MSTVHPLKDPYIFQNLSPSIPQTPPRYLLFPYSSPQRHQQLWNSGWHCGPHTPLSHERRPPRGVICVDGSVGGRAARAPGAVDRVAVCLVSVGVVAASLASAMVGGAHAAVGFRGAIVASTPANPIPSTPGAVATLAPISVGVTLISVGIVGLLPNLRDVIGTYIPLFPSVSPIPPA